MKPTISKSVSIHHNSEETFQLYETDRLYAPIETDAKVSYSD